MLDLKYLDVVVGTVAVYCVYRLMTLEKRALSLPPGPRGFPLIGNLLDVPAEREWLTFAKWGETYGMWLHVTCICFGLINFCVSGKLASVTGACSTVVLAVHSFHVSLQSSDNLLSSWTLQVLRKKCWIKIVRYTRIVRWYLWEASCVVGRIR